MERTTSSGIPLKAFYTPADIEEIEYGADLGDVGEYPYTRGVYSEGYRGKEWTRRQQTGFGSPSDTNRRIRLYLEHGFTGVNVTLDNLGYIGIDPDHPRAEHDVGIQGMSLCSLRDIEVLTEGLALDNLSWIWETSAFSTPFCLGSLYLICEKQGIDLSTLRGTFTSDPLTAYWDGFMPEGYAAIPLGLKLFTDAVEFCSKNMPKLYITYIDSYNIREQGFNAVQEAAFCLAKATLLTDRIVKRGLAVDEFGPRISFFCSVSMDFFEEIAKLRAMRKLWAKIMRDRYGAKDARTLKFRFAVETAGSSLTPQQPLINIARITCETLAAALANAQAMTPACYDEPICLPSESAGIMSARIQQIVTYETGISNVADPLGGSYYVEALTKKLEEEIIKLMGQIEDRGGILEAIRTGWFDEEREKAAIRQRQEIENGQRIIVGVNAFTEGDEKLQVKEVFRPPIDSILKHQEDIKKLKAERNNDEVEKALRKLHEEALRGEEVNLMPPILEAIRAYATIGEVNGFIRLAWGLPYDPFGEICAPFDIK